MLKNPLERTYVDTVCKIGQLHECCRYLVAGSLGFECCKNTSLKKELDSRVTRMTIVARGDNCDGVNPPTEIKPEPRISGAGLVVLGMTAMLGNQDVIDFSDAETSSDDDSSEPDTQPDSAPEWSGDGGDFSGGGASGDF